MRLCQSLKLSLILVMLIVCNVVKPVTDTFVLSNAVMYRETEETKSQDAPAGDLNLECAAAVLIEPVSGKIIYEKNKDTKMPPASVTKIMTMLLIMENIDKKKISYNDMVSVSAHAASMGGSQVFLEEGETQTVDTMLKCIAVSSANDACVAMAEYISGSEEAFVQQMNQRAKELGMNNTNFVNCCGLDVDGHETTAYDIALMSRELITKHPDIYKYTTIWMDTITHTTAKGSSEFGLSNTNKLIKQYNGATGLKTGSTSKAKFCLSATARRNDMDMIAVVMAANDAKARVQEATKLLDYGFSNCSLYQKKVQLKKNQIAVERGSKKTVTLDVPDTFQYVCVANEDANAIKEKVTLKKNLKAPVKKGAVLGTVQYYLNNEVIGKLDITAAQTVDEWKITDCIKNVWQQYQLQ